MNIEADVLAEIVRAHAPHTVILYGSRARGDATAESDVDIVAYADVDETYRDARRWNGVFLDVFVHPTAKAEETSEEELKLLGGEIVLDQRGLGAPLLERLAALDSAGPPTLPETERQVRRVWAHKMLARIRRDDVEAHYRHHWLLFQLLEDDFALHGGWFRGPKRSLVELRARRPATYEAMARALAPAGGVEALATLVTLVAGTEDAGD